MKNTSRKRMKYVGLIDRCQKDLQLNLILSAVFTVGANLPDLSPLVEFFFLVAALGTAFIAIYNRTKENKYKKLFEKLM